MDSVPPGRRVVTLSSRTVRLAGLLAICTTGIVIGAHGQADPDVLWVYDARSAITHHELTALGTVFASTGSATMALDPTAGTEVWTSSVLRDCRVDTGSGFPELLCRYGDWGRGNLIIPEESHIAWFSNDRGTAAFDLSTGTVPAMWDASAWRGRKTTFLRGAHGDGFMLSDPNAGAPIEIAGIVSAGETRTWRTTLPFADWLREGKSVNRPYSSSPSPGPLLLAGRTSDGRVGLIGIDRESGAVQWLQLNVPQSVLNPVGILKAMGRTVFLDNAHVDYPTPTMAIVSSDYQAPGGEPFAVDLRTGEILWQASGLYSATDMASCVYPCVVLGDGRVYVMHSNSVSALSLTDGRVLWQTALRGPTTVMAVVPQGLLAGCTGRAVCDGTLDLLDAESGIPRWPEPVRMADGTQRVDPAALTPGTAEVIWADGPRLHAVDVARGTARELGSVGRSPIDSEGAIVVTSTHAVVVTDSGLTAFGRDGSGGFRKTYAVPRAGLWQAFGRTLIRETLNQLNYQSAQAVATQQARQNAYLSALSGGQGSGVGVATYAVIHPAIRERVARGEAALDSAYIYTSTPTASGRTGVSVVRLSYEDGRELGRAWLNRRAPSFVLDPLAPRLYERESRTIRAIPFVPAQ